LQAELVQDATDAAGTDGRAGLADLLGDDLGRGVGIEEAVANDFAGNLRGAAGRRRGARLVAEQGKAPALAEGGEELVIALPGVAELGGGGPGGPAVAIPGE
jgi:hypothetical protein